MSPKTKRVPEYFFIRKLEFINENERKEIEDFIAVNKNKILYFEYGHIPHFRTYKIVLRGKQEKVWELRRRIY